MRSVVKKSTATIADLLKRSSPSFSRTFCLGNGFTKTPSHAERVFRRCYIGARVSELSGHHSRFSVHVLFPQVF